MFLCDTETCMASKMQEKKWLTKNFDKTDVQQNDIISQPLIDLPLSNLNELETVDTNFLVNLSYSKWNHDKCIKKGNISF